MPADHGLRPDDLQSVQHAGCQPIQPGNPRRSMLLKVSRCGDFTSQHVELMTKRQDLCLQRRSRPEQSDQRQPNQAATSFINQEHRPIRLHLLAGLSFRHWTTLILNRAPMEAGDVMERSPPRLERSFITQLRSFYKFSGSLGRPANLLAVCLAFPTGSGKHC